MRVRDRRAEKPPPRVSTSDDRFLPVSFFFFFPCNLYDLLSFFVYERRRNSRDVNIITEYICKKTNRAIRSGKKKKFDTRSDIYERR